MQQKYLHRFIHLLRLVGALFHLGLQGGNQLSLTLGNRSLATHNIFRGDSFSIKGCIHLRHSLDFTVHGFNAQQCTLGKGIHQGRGGNSIPVFIRDIRSSRTALLATRKAKIPTENNFALAL